MCCGQKRTELRNSQASRTARSVPHYVSVNSRAQAVRTQPPDPQKQSTPPQPETTVSTPHAPTSVRYLENPPIRVRGLVSGMSYEFSGSRPVQQVDSRDAPSLLNTRFFRRA
jgi:hypothetical protein